MFDFETLFGLCQTQSQSSQTIEQRKDHDWVIPKAMQMERSNFLCGPLVS